MKFWCTRTDGFYLKFPGARRIIGHNPQRFWPKGGVVVVEKLQPVAVGLAVPNGTRVKPFFLQPMKIPHLVHGGGVPSLVGILVVVDEDAALAIEKAAVYVCRPSRIGLEIKNT